MRPIIYCSHHRLDQTRGKVNKVKLGDRKDEHLRMVNFIKEKDVLE